MSVSLLLKSRNCMCRVLFLSAECSSKWGLFGFSWISGLPKGYRMTSSDLGAEYRSTELFPGPAEDTLGLLTFSSCRAEFMNMVSV